MSVNKADDYWNRSLSTGFSFDDEEDSLKSSFNTSALNFDVTVTDPVFGTTSLETDLNVFPIQSIISKKNLDAVLDDVVLPTILVCRDIKETIQRMLLRQPYDLYYYRSFDMKTKLLDEAINTMDGDVILTVVLYLVKTLNNSNFYRIIQKRRVALNVYARYLMSQIQIEQISNLFLTTGCNLDMIEVFYIGCIDVSNTEGILSKLKHFLIGNFGEICSEKEKLVLCDYKRFLEWQKDRNIKTGSVTEALAALCINVWEKQANENEIIEFKKLMKIGDFQYEWILLNTLASVELWKKISEMFIKANWLTKKNTIKSVIGPETFLLGLYRHNPPKHTIEEFLNCITDSETSLNLAKKMKCYRFVIDYYINQKDRLGLILYKNQLPVQSEDFFYAEGCLHSHNIKWKN